MEKLFKTYDELLDFLQEEKMLAIGDKEKAKRILTKTSYFSLISGYKDIFKNPATRKYCENASFEEIYSLYQFDGELRSVFLKYILIAERSVKASLAYHFSEVYGENQEQYLAIDNYDLHSRKNRDGIEKLLSVLSLHLANKNDYVYIRHYQQKYHNVPLWVMVQVLTLGQVAHMFDYLKGTVPIKVCRDFHGIERVELHTFLSVMTKYRNACAHGERFFNYVTKDSIKDTLVHKKLEIPRENGRYIFGKNDLFSEVIVLKYLLDQEDFHDFYYDLKRCISKRKPEKRILNMMGFPENWRQVLRLKV
ncbi:MAG: Abi family protein [Lachnospiraceae bacterium]